MKVEYKGRMDRCFDVWIVDTEKPLELFKSLEEVSWKIIEDSEALSFWDSEDSLSVYFQCYGRFREILRFQARPELNQVAILINSESSLGESLARFVLHELKIDYPTISAEDKRAVLAEQFREERLKKVRESLTPIDYQVLNLRSMGVSMRAISEQLAVSFGKVRCSIEKLSSLPEMAEKLGAFKAMSRVERFKKPLQQQR